MSVSSLSFLSFFFFQAEDGIRDKLVTGVQTCALPISAPGGALHPLRELRQRLLQRLGPGERDAPADDPRLRDERQPAPRRPRRAAAPVSPTKLGYKLTKYLVSMTFSDQRPGGYWEDQGYPWFGGI